MAPMWAFFPPNGMLALPVRQARPCRFDVARQVLSGYKEPPGKWPREHVPTRREAARRKFAALLEAATTDV